MIKSIQEHFHSSNIKYAAGLHSSNILSKAQINQVQDVSQKVIMHCPYSIAKAMDGLFKYNGNRTWFAPALSLWDHLINHSFHSMGIREKNGSHAKTQPLFQQMILSQVDSA